MMTPLARLAAGNATRHGYYRCLSRLQSTSSLATGRKGNSAAPLPIDCTTDGLQSAIPATRAMYNAKPNSTRSKRSCEGKSESTRKIVYDWRQVRSTQTHVNLSEFNGISFHQWIVKISFSFVTSNQDICLVSYCWRCQSSGLYSSK